MKNAPKFAQVPTLGLVLLWAIMPGITSGCERTANEKQQEPDASSPRTTAATAPATPSAPEADAEATADGGTLRTTPPIAPSAAAPTPVSPSAASHSDWPWRAPESWQLLPEPRPMRLATYQAQGPDGSVEIAISRFPGDVGGMLANVNRWRGQVGLPPTTQGELAGMIESFQSSGFEGSLLHIKGTEQHIVVASLYETDADRTWTVRVSGSEAVATALKDDVFKFARTFGKPDE